MVGSNAAFEQADRRHELPSDAPAGSTSQCSNDTNGDGNGDGDGFICNCAFGYYGTPVANTVYGDSNFVACTRSLSF